MATTFAVPDGRVAMAATLYTGTGATQTISNAVNTVSFQPDLVWIKSRNTAGSNILQDSVRGATIALFSDGTTADTTLVNGLTAFASNGFTLGSGAATNQNTSATTYIGWNWKAGGTAVSNTAGTITSSVSANPTAGFSVVTFTAPSSGSGTVGHGVQVGGVATTPSMIILKSRSNADNWTTYHSSLGGSSALFLNLTNASSALTWGTINTTVFTADTAANVTASRTYVAYCWAPVAGYSAFGSYTGNGSADGPFIYTGFRPRWVMVKCSAAAESWYIFDSSRNTYNVTDLGLVPNMAIAEFSSNTFDFVSNGIKIRTTNTLANSSSTTYIYAAFAENPLKYANAR